MTVARKARSSLRATMSLLQSPSGRHAARRDAAYIGEATYTGDDWRVCIKHGDLPRNLASFRQALTVHLKSRLGRQVTVSSNAAEIFVYAPSAGLADEAAQVARQLLAWRDLSATVQTEGWQTRYQRWWDAARVPAESPARRHADRQEAERKRSAESGVPAWHVRAEVESHRDMTPLARYLAAQGWQVRRRLTSVIIAAPCEDDAKSLARALAGGLADVDAVRVRRVSYRSRYNGAYPVTPS